MKTLNCLALIIILWLSLHGFGQTPDNRGVKTPLAASTSEKRLALVIGNSAYQYVDKLKNPVNDETDVVAALKKLGFEVMSGIDLTLPQMRKLVRDFGTKLQQQKGIGLFYYSGHGVQVGGHNYLVPVDANIETETETPDYSLDSDLVLRYMRDADNEFNMMILDACRNNPFAQTWRRYNPKRTLDEDQGLARITPASGTIILYSTEPGKTASDGNDRNGLFTGSFLSNIDKPNIEFDTFVKLIARDVRQKSGGRQSPWKEGLYDGDFFFTEGRNSSAQSVSEASWNNVRGIAKNLLKYDYVDNFIEDLAIVCLNQKCGFIDRTGTVVIPLKYESESYFSEGLVCVKLNGKWGYIDKTGKEIVSPKYDQVIDFGNGLAPVRLNNKWGYIDKTGRVVIPIKYEDISLYSEGLIGVQLNGKFGYIDKTEKVIIPFKYDDGTTFSDGLAAIKLGDKWGFINKHGDMIIQPEYDAADVFSKGLGEVAIGVADSIGDDGKSSTEYNWGFVNKNGELVKLVPHNPEALGKSLNKDGYVNYYYNSIGEFSEGLAEVRRHGKQGFIDETGKEVIPLKYDYCDCDTFSEGLAKVSLNEKFGFIDKSGREVIPIKYDDIWCEALRKKGIIGLMLNGKKGFVDIYGNEYFDF